MEDFRAELKWSGSRQGMFDSCRRNYYYQYYGYWDGWLDEAPIERKTAYLLKNITGVDAYVGQLVHRWASGICDRLKNGYPMDIDAEYAVKQLDQAFLESEKKMWLESPTRKVRFFEDHYRGGLTPEQKQEKREKLTTCINNFLASPLCERLAQHSKEICWLWIDPDKIDPASEFSVDSIKAFAKLDLAIRSAGKVYVWDFKTGKQDDSEADQMQVYGLYALQRWGGDTDTTVCATVGLYPTFRSTRYPLTVESLVDLEAKIKAGYAAMEALHRAGLAFDRLAFIAQPEDWRCGHCNFREICLVQ